jgi:subtilisin family serine protease
MVAASCSAALLSWRPATHTSTANGPAAPQATAGAHPADTVVVRATDPAHVFVLATRATAEGYRIVGIEPALAALQLAPPAGLRAPDAASRWSEDPDVRYAEPVSRVVSADLPADPLFATQAAYLAPVRAPEAWDIERGRPEVVVAVLDTGIDRSHPDLQARVWTNPREQPNGIDDDANGCVDDLHGCAFVADPEPGCAARANGDIADDLGHGTFVSGIIGASGDGGGMVGVARGVTIMPVKILDCVGGGSTFGLAQGILYAVQNGAHVLNVSLGGPVDSAFVREAIRIAHDEHGVLLVAATGNDEGRVAYPARYPNVLAVGAASVANPDVRAPFSPSGPEIDVVAIGEGVIGTVAAGTCEVFLPCVPGEDPGRHAPGNGTSFAAPQVTGLVALMLSRNRFLGPLQVASIIRGSAQPLPDGDRPGWAGAGRVDMLRALLPPFRLGAPGVSRE